MINFYVRKIEDVISEKELPTAILSFGMERKNEILSISNEKKQLESAAGTILLNQLLVDTGYRKDEIVKDSKGAPKLKNQKEIECSISHSGDYVCCAISNQVVGIDIQKMKDGKRERIIERFFHKKEIELYQSNPSLDLFYKIWTSKEGYVKMKKTGLAGNMDSFYLNLDRKRIISSDEQIVANVYFERVETYMLCIVSRL